MRLSTRIRLMREPRARRDYFAMDALAARVVRDYQRAVAADADRAELASILTGLAGCELSMSCLQALGWGPEPLPDGRELSEAIRTAGLLLLEVAACAAEGDRYRGVRAREFETELVAGALRVLALSYARGEGVGPALDGVGRAVVPVIGGQAAECLVPLMTAHGAEARWVEDGDRS